MMILRSSSASPFARKVRIASTVLGLDDRIDVVPTDTNDPSDELRRYNPLGKVPTLVLEDGRAIYDSRVILEYLDHVAGGGRLIPADASRFVILTRASLADGLSEAALLMVYERRWRETAAHSARWLSHQNDKVHRALAALEVSTTDSLEIDVAAIALACALGYLDLRFEGEWRKKHSRLANWLEQFARLVPAFQNTRHIEG